MAYERLNSRQIKAELKANGINTKNISVREDRGGLSWSFTVRLKSFDYTIEDVERVVNKFRHVDRDEYSGEILSGGNTYIHVQYDYDFQHEQENKFLDTAKELISELKENEGVTVEKFGNCFCIPCGQPYPLMVFVNKDDRYRADSPKSLALFLAQITPETQTPPKAFTELSYKQVMELAKEYIVKDDSTKVSSPDETAEYLYPILAPLEVEKFFTLILNPKNRIVDIIEVTSGLLDRSHVHAREVFRPAIKANAHKIILAHNHPSGEVYPSSVDFTTTKKLVDAGELLGIQVIDHIVIGKGKLTHNQGFYSFAQGGKI